jgi:hypothetical protein
VKEKTVGGESVVLGLVVQNCRRDVADASSELQPSVSFCVTTQTLR